MERRLQFFSSPNEFDDVVWSVAAEHGTWFVPWLPATGGTPFEIGPNARIASSGLYERAYLSPEPMPGFSMRSASDAIPDLQDGILLLVPDLRGKALIMGELIWSSSPTPAAGDGRTPGRILFDRLSRPLRKGLFYPTWGQNVVYGGNPRAYRSIGHTQVAADHVTGGGELVARESLNVRFFVEEPRPLPVRPLPDREPG